MLGHRKGDIDMNEMEKAALRHVREWLRYEQSNQASNDRLIDIARRAKINRALGHSPKCGILKCHPECNRSKKE